MRVVGLLMLGLASALSFGAAAEDLPRQFDLECRISGKSSADPTNTFHWVTTFHVDRAAGLFCTDDCRRMLRLSRNGPDTLEFHCERHRRPQLCTTDFETPFVFDGLLFEEKVNWVISLADLGYRSQHWAIVGDVAATPRTMSEQGRCERHPFSGFNGQYLYGEAAAKAEGLHPQSALPPAFAEAFAPEVLLRLTVVPRFAPPYAVWLRRDGAGYRIASRYGDARCSRPLDGARAVRIAAAWKAMLTHVDTASQPQVGNRTINFFAMRGDFGVAAGWREDPDSGTSTPPVALKRLGEAMAEYCATGTTEWLSSIDRALAALETAYP